MGGSGGGGRSLSPEEMEQLEQTAKKLMRKDSQPSKRNAFISFASEDLDNVNLLRGQAKNENSDLEFSDYSIKEPFDSKNADYIKQKIRENIKQASVTICFVSEDTAKSKWVDLEIRESIKLGKGVIAMYQGDKPPKNIPPATKENKIKLIPWNQKVITAEIEKAAKNR
jgi:DNA-directed RNA polymerase subunit L